MNRKGVIGQILASFPVLIMIVFIMILFVIISVAISGITGGAGKVGGGGVVLGDYDVNSRVLVELFLGDFIVINLDEVVVKDAIRQMDNEESDEKKVEIARKIQELFDERYGCDRKNVLLIYKEKSDTGYSDFSVDIDHTSYINYPDTFDEVKIRENDFLDIRLADENSYKIKIGELNIFVEEIVKC